MVTQTHRRDVFHAIADPNRRAIIELLARKQLTLNGVAEHFSISRPAISKHIKVLTECGLVQVEQRGRERFCQVKPEKLDEVASWLEHYKQLWTTRLDALEDYLAELQGKEKPNREEKKQA